MSSDIVQNILDNFHTNSDASAAISGAQNVFLEEHVLVTGEGSYPYLQLVMDDKLQHVVVHAFVKDHLKCRPVVFDGKPLPGKLIAATKILYNTPGTPDRVIQYESITTPGLGVEQREEMPNLDQGGVSRALHF